MAVKLPTATAAPRIIARGLQGSEHRALLMAGDTVAAVLAAVLALWLWSIPAGAEFSVAFLTEKSLWLVAAAVWLAMAAFPAASPAIAFSIRRTTAVLLRAAALLLFAYLAAYFYVPRGVLPRLTALYFLWEAVLLTVAWRLLFVAIFSRARFRRRAIIIGSGEGAATALGIMRQHYGRQSDVVGVVPEAHLAARALEGTEVVQVEHLVDAVERKGVSQLVLAWGGQPPADLLEVLLACQQVGIELIRAQTLYEQMLERVPVDLLDADWLLTDLADAVRTRDASWRGKRLLDITGALAGLAVLAVLAPVIAAAIAIETGFPILYRQRRVGRAGTPLTITKFRTMVQGAERPGQARWAQAGDPRATRVGRVLRKLRLDEWPQLVRVLSGDMSLVGPRPEREEFVAELERQIPFYRARLMVPPGLTGWAQVNLPYADSVDAARAKLEYDLYYVKYRSAAFDVRILFRTLGTVVGARGV
jgi:exopolysaccharide biosynthesis polyprenyl glycosylphosphotransferase